MYVSENTDGRGDLRLLPTLHFQAKLHHNAAQQIIMANDMDDFLVGSPSKFEWQRQSSSASSTAQVEVETDGVDSHSHQAASLQQCAKMMSTMANLIQASNTYADTIAERSSDFIEEMKKDIVKLAECILQVEARLSALEDNNRNGKDTADTFKTSGPEEVSNDALHIVNDRIDAMADSVDILETRLGGIERRVRNIEKLLLKCYKRRKSKNQQAAADVESA